MFKGGKKMSPKPKLLFFIPRGSFLKFYSGILANFNLLHLLPIRTFARAKTSSVSRSKVESFSISLILPHISTSQASDKFESLGPSRLATRSLANFARSASERASASDRSVSNCAVVMFSPHTGGILQIMHHTVTHNKRQRAPDRHGRKNRRAVSTSLRRVLGPSAN